MKRAVVYTRADGGELALRAPRTQRDYAELQVALVSEDLDGALVWLGEHLLSHTYLIAPETPASWEDLVRYVLTPQDIYRLATAITDAVTPAGARDDIIRLAYVGASGGCRCMVCVEQVDDPDHAARFCRYGTISDHAAVIWQLAAPHLDAPLLDAPPYLSLVKSWVDAGRAKAAREKRDRADDKHDVDRVLAAHG